MSTVIREEYLDRCEALASSLARPGTRGLNGVEFDDLVQEGLVNVWQSIARGVRPSDIIIKRRMIDYMRWLGRQGVAYEKMLPIDAFNTLHRDSRTDVRQGTAPLTGEENDDAARRHRFRPLGEVPGD